MEKIEGGNKFQFRLLWIHCLIAFVAVLAACNKANDGISAESIDSTTIQFINNNFILGQEQHFQEFIFDYPYGWPYNIHIPLNSAINNGGRLSFIGNDYWEIIGIVKLNQQSVAELLFDEHEDEWTVTTLSDGTLMYTLANRDKWMVNGFDSSAIIYIYPNGESIVDNPGSNNEIQNLCRFDILLAKKK